MFMQNLIDNPSKRAIDELYLFLEHKMPITPEGTFIAYKGLREDYYSITSGKLELLHGKVDEQGHIFNGIGETIECVRNNVCDNKDISCSTGLHAGSKEYATGFAQGKVVRVEINPKDGDAFVARGLTYAVLGRTREAVRDLRQFLSLAEPNNAMRKIAVDYIAENSSK